MAVNQFGDTIEESSAPATTAFGDPVVEETAVKPPESPAPPVEKTSFGDPLITDTPAPAAPADRYAALAAGDSPFAPASPAPSTFAAPTLESTLQDTNNAGGFGAFLQPLDPLQVSGLATPMNADNILASMGKPDVWLRTDEKRKNREKLISQVGDDVLADLLIERAKITRKIEQLPNEKGEAGGLGSLDPKALHDLTAEQMKIDSLISARESARPSIDVRRAEAVAEAQAKLSGGIKVGVDRDGGMTVTGGPTLPPTEWPAGGKVSLRNIRPKPPTVEEFQAAQAAASQPPAPREDKPRPPFTPDQQVLSDLSNKLRAIKQMETPADVRQRLVDELAQDQTPVGTAFNQFLGSVTEQISGVTGLTKRIFGVSRSPDDFESATSEMGGLMKAVAAKDTSGLGSVARGVGTVGGLMAGGPGGRLGLVVGALRAGSEAYSSTLEQTHDETKALKAAGETVPGLLLFMGLGKVAGGFASSLASESSVAVKTLASLTGATLANVGSSTVLRVLAAEPGHEAEAAMPTVETLTADTLFAVFHAHGDYMKASKEAKAKAYIELQRRGFTREEIAAGSEEPAGKAPADAVIPEPPEVAEANRAEAARKQAALDSAAKSAEIAGMPLTAQALKAEAARHGAAATPPEPAPAPEPAPEPPKPAATRPARPPLSGPIAEIHRPEVDLIARLRSPYESPEPKQSAPPSDPTAPESATKPEAPGKPAVPNEGTGAPAQGEVPPIEFVQPERVKRRPADDREDMVTIRVPEFDAAWKGSESEKTFYIGADGENEIKGRREGFKAWRAANPNAPIETPEVSVGKDGTPSFTNGRHRYAVLRDAGEPTIKVSMSPESVENARRHGLIVDESAARDLTPAEQSEIDAELEREHREAEEEWRREQEAHRAEVEGEYTGGLGSNELLDVLRRLGGLPSLDRDTSLTGELAGCGKRTKVT